MIFSIKALNKQREYLQNNLIRLVVATGCFDVFHRGHLAYLQRAKLLGDILWVGVNSDASITNLKGPNRPINNQNNRAEILDALKCVDAVTIYEDTNDFLRIIRPDIWVKGGDYTLDSLNQQEVNTVKTNGGIVYIIPIEYDVSSTSLIKQL